MCVSLSARLPDLKQRTDPPSHSGPFNVQAVCCFGAGTVIFLMRVMKSSDALLILHAVLYGFFSGAFISLVSPVTVSISRDLSEIGCVAFPSLPLSLSPRSRLGRRSTLVSFPFPPSAFPDFCLLLAQHPSLTLTRPSPTPRAPTASAKASPSSSRQARASPATPSRGASSPCTTASGSTRSCSPVRRHLLLLSLGFALVATRENAADRGEGRARRTGTMVLAGSVAMTVGTVLRAKEKGTWRV